MSIREAVPDAESGTTRRWRISWQGYIPILLTVFIGMATTWALVEEVSRLENSRVQTAFTAAARDRVLVVQRELQSSLNVVQDIGSFLDTSRRVRRGQFREFVLPVLKRDPSIQSLEWVVQVEPGERAAFLAAARLGFPRFDFLDLAGKRVAEPQAGAHFILLYAHPYESGRTPLGLDYSTVPSEFSSLMRTAEQGTIQVTQGWVSLPQSSEQVELSVYLPAFERPDDERDSFQDVEIPVAVEDGSARLRGIAIGRFRIGEIVDRALSHLSPSGIDIEFKVIEQDQGPRTLYTHRSRLRTTGVVPEYDTDTADRVLSYTIDIAGKQWTLICRAVPGSYPPSVWSARFVLAGGVAFTLLLAAYLFSLIGRAEEVERLVSQRTLELEHSNEALNRQVRERLKAEKALQALNTNLEQRVALRAAEAGRRAAELEQFAYVASHDLKAPLRAIANLANWLTEDLAGKLTPETEEQLALMRDRVARMHGLIEGLLTYSRVGRTERVIETVDCGLLVAEVIDSLAPPSGFEIELAPDLPVLNTDRMQLGQVFSNLIGNSIKHRQTLEGRIQVRGRDAGSYCEFAVADDGPGIPPEYHDKVFMMFQTLQVRDFGSNTGIGLALVKKIVEENGGVIHLKSEEGKGTEISFTWAKEGRRS